MTARPAVRPLLAPLTPLYRLALASRELRLRRGWEPVRRLQFPVVSVGNLSTGGAGKTPLTIALATALTLRRFSVDVLSRGYGRKENDPVRVDPRGRPEEYGDEPILIAREAPVRVYVASERYRAGKLAEADVSPEDRDPVHILDDGFQHRQLHRDVNILLLNREVLQGRLLPAGNLREPLHAAHRADILVIPENEPDFEAELRSLGWEQPVWRLRRCMDVPKLNVPVVAFCGIARPDQFFAGIEAAGLRIEGRFVFPDHHRYTPADIQRLLRAAKQAGDRALVTTQKDEVRIQGADPKRPMVPIITVGLRVEIRDESEAMDWLAGRLRNAQGRPRL